MRRGGIVVEPATWRVVCPEHGLIAEGLDSRALARFASRSHWKTHNLKLELPPLRVHEAKEDIV